MKDSSACEEKRIIILKKIDIIADDCNTLKSKYLINKAGQNKSMNCIPANQDTGIQTNLANHLFAWSMKTSIYIPYHPQPSEA